MREIKFRAWDKRTRKMVETGFHVLGEVTAFDLLYQYGMEHGKRKNEPGILRMNSFILMQYTGLHDKNGKEIYEGDIISYPDTESDYVDVGIGVGLKCAEMSCYGFAPVVFALGTFGLDCDGGESLGRGFHSFEWITDTYGFTFKELEVIGNIYENPELAEAQKEGM